MRELSIRCQTYGSADDNCGNIKSALSRGLPSLSPAICANDGTLVIAASGPSLPEFINEIKEEKRTICAVNGAYDFLVESGRVPELFLTVDPRPMPQNVKLPKAETVFLLASRVSPELFDRLKDYKVMLWHSFGSLAEVEAYTPNPAIGGGSTSGMRAITVGYILGFRKFVLYGMDSCLAPDRLTKRFTGEQAGQVVDVIVGDKTFYCNGAMAQQANEFQEIYKTFPDIEIAAKGDGLIAEIIKQRKRMADDQRKLHTPGGPDDGVFPVSVLDSGLNLTG